MEMNRKSMEEISKVVENESVKNKSEDKLGSKRKDDGSERRRRQGVDEMTKLELVKEIKRRRMKGYSGMNMVQLKVMLKNEVKKQMTLGMRRKTKRAVGGDGHHQAASQGDPGQKGGEKDHHFLREWG